MWRQLRDEDERFLKNLNAGVIPPPKASTNTAIQSAPSAAKDESQPSRSQPDPHAPPPRLAEDAPAEGEATTLDNSYSAERLRDYVGAFVLAGLDPHVGAELEFFADNVTYFGKPNVPKEKIRADLLRYDRRWPERRFWLAGELNVRCVANEIFTVTFPLAYELRSSSERASGKVVKTLTLRKAADNQFEIIAVSERQG